MNTLSRFAAAIAAATTLSAQANPIAAPGTEGYSVVVGTTGDVYATYQGTTASYTDILLLNGVQIFVNQLTPVGTTVDLGSFTAGSELIFQLYVSNTGNSFYTGPADRNPDDHAHARVQADWGTIGTTLVSFEDLLGGPYDYNDLSFSFTNTVSSPTVPSAVPEPATGMLMLAGAATFASLLRRLRHA